MCFGYLSASYTLEWLYALSKRNFCLRCTFFIIWMDASISISSMVSATNPHALLAASILKQHASSHKQKQADAEHTNNHDCYPHGVVGYAVFFPIKVNSVDPNGSILWTTCSMWSIGQVLTLAIVCHCCPPRQHAQCERSSMRILLVPYQ